MLRREFFQQLVNMTGIATTGTVVADIAGLPSVAVIGIPEQVCGECGFTMLFVDKARTIVECISPSCKQRGIHSPAALVYR